MRWTAVDSVVEATTIHPKVDRWTANLRRTVKSSNLLFYINTLCLYGWIYTLRRGSIETLSTCPPGARDDDGGEAMTDELHAL